MSVDREQLREGFRSIRGYWDDDLEAVLELDPEFLRTYLDYSSLPWRRAGGLSAMQRELICLAVYASSTLLHEKGIRRHVANAVRQGASAEEILEILEIVSTQGMHGPAVAMTVLREETAVRENGSKPGVDGSFTPKQEAIRERFTQPNGRNWLSNARADAFVAMDPEYFDKYLDLMDLAWRRSSSLKFKALVCIAMDSATTHQYAPGTRFHIREALRVGATPAEIMEVLELVTVIGFESCLLGAPILLEALPPQTTAAMPTGSSAS